MEYSHRPRRTYILQWIIGIIVFILITGPVLFPVLFRPRRTDGYHNCLNNMKQIGTAIFLYQADWNETTPVLWSIEQKTQSGRTWTDAIRPYTKSKMVLFCPGTEGKHASRDRLTYSFNRRLSGIKRIWINKPNQVALVFDSVNDSPANNNVNGDTFWRWGDNGLPSTGNFVVWLDRADIRSWRWPDWAKPRHHGINNVLFADAHAKPLQPGEVPRMSPK